eukprot:GILI01024348.1.p1 GENE.GILI01024348.1~~GILI01024348.1.p1  ORF type:complete len:839 (-),score=65.84 GILI01024348.1:119-2635(-)
MVYSAELTGGLWIQTNSEFQMINNSLQMFALMVSSAGLPQALYLDEASPLFDPFYVYKNASNGAIPFCRFQNTYIANPNGSITIASNNLYLFNGTVADRTLIPFKGYPNYASAEFDKSFIGKTYDQIVAIINNISSYNGYPTAFVHRNGPPIVRPFNWIFGKPSTWDGVEIPRYPDQSSFVVLLKNNTAWSNDLRINLCSNYINDVLVGGEEISLPYKTLTNFKGNSLNAELGIAGEEGVGIVLQECPTAPTLTISSSRTETHPNSNSLSPKATASLTTIRTPTISETRTIEYHAATDGSGDSTTKLILELSSKALGSIVPTIGSAIGGSSLNQMTISSSILRMSSCIGKTRDAMKGVEKADGDSEDGGDSLPIMMHPLRFSVAVYSPLHQERGAILGNLAVTVASLLFVRFVAVYIAGKFVGSGEDSRLIVGWPSALTLPFVALAEGTSTCATRLLSRASSISPGLLAVNYIFGTATFISFAAVLGWWAFSITKTMPTRQIRRAKTHHPSWGSWLLEPRFEWKRLPEKTAKEPSTEKQQNPHQQLEPQLDIEVENDELNSEVEAPPLNQFSLTTVLSEAEFVVVMQQYAHLYGDKFYLWVEVACLICAVAVGVSEGLSDALCHTKITMASVVAFCQILLNLTASIPSELVVQTLLGLCTAALSSIALVRVHMKEVVGEPLEAAMEIVGSIGNALGLLAIGVSLLSIAVRLLRARVEAMVKQLRNLREMYSKSATKSFSEVDIGKMMGMRRAEIEEELLLLDGDSGEFSSDQLTTRQKKKVKSNVNQAFEVHLDAFDDLGTFLLEAEQAAMQAHVDDLDIEMVTDIEKLTQMETDEIL